MLQNILNKYNLERTIVFFFVGVFAITIVLAVFLMALYYITPSNYVLEDKKKNIPYAALSLELKPDSVLDFDNVKCVGFDKQVQIIVHNFFKSQSLTLEPDKVIRIRYNSTISIKSNSDNTMIVRMDHYL